MATGLSGLADAYHPQLIKLRQRLEGLVPEWLRCEPGRVVGGKGADGAVATHRGQG